jgi:hypothetical protein
MRFQACWKRTGRTRRSLPPLLGANPSSLGISSPA